MPDLLLGLIGDNITRSKSPLFHQLAGRQHALAVRYDRLIPKDLDQDFHTVFSQCSALGYRGINITYPYKEIAISLVKPGTKQVAALGAINTVLFTKEGPVGYNTDFSGFVAAYQSVRKSQSPGKVCMVGAGGVGKAVAFGLLDLGASEIRVVDLDLGKAEVLAGQLASVNSNSVIHFGKDVAEGCKGATGIINCTPVGMVGLEGTAVNKAQLENAEWVFDAVYTPVETEFLQLAKAGGLEIISGYELFFNQAVHAWKLFSGLDVNEIDMREALIRESGTA